jgi:hypothetical protein
LRWLFLEESLNKSIVWAISKLPHHHRIELSPETAVRPFDNAKASRLGGLNSRCLLPQKLASNPSFDDYKTRLPTEDL